MVITAFIRVVRRDFKDETSPVPKLGKRKCFWRAAATLLSMIWSGASAPIIYPLWYLFRRSIVARVYHGTSWEEVDGMISECRTEEVRAMLRANGKLWHWLWTYGDGRDPLGRGDLPSDYKDGKNTFWNRFSYSALRNPRFLLNYMDYRTGRITDSVTVIDGRDFTLMHVSPGIGDSPDGIYFKWMKDNNGRWYFIYEDNSSKRIFYLGYTGLLHEDVGKSGGRFETSLRRTVRSYKK